MKASKKLAVMAILGALLIPGYAWSASNASVDVVVDTLGAGCTDTLFEIQTSWLNEVDDGDGFDVVGMIAFDGAGLPIASDWSGSIPGVTSNRTTPFGNGTGINDLTTRPLTIEVYDLVVSPPGGINFQAQYDFILAQAAPLLLSTTYDPALDVAACAELEQVDTSGLVRVQVNKTFSDGNDAEVDVTLTCSTGNPLEQDFTIEGGGDGVLFIVENAQAGGTCAVTESGGPAGYTAVFNGGDGCTWEDVTGGYYLCDITNEADPAEFTVTKEWIVSGAVGEEVIEAAEVSIFCNNSIQGGYWNGSEYQYNAFLEGDGDSVTVSVDTTTRSAQCRAVEDVLQSGVESEDNCGTRTIPAGGSSSCTITNTVFFEGIPTLSQWGMALMALLMLGVGFIGLRRFA